MEESWSEGPIVAEASLLATDPAPSSMVAEIIATSLAKAKGNVEVLDILALEKIPSPFSKPKGIFIKEPIALSPNPLVMEEDFPIS